MCLPNLVRISKKCFLLILFVWWRVRYQETALFSGVSCFRAMPISSLSLAVSLSLILSMELFIHSWQLDYCPLAVEHSRSLMGTLASFWRHLKGLHVLPASNGFSVVASSPWLHLETSYVGNCIFQLSWHDDCVRCFAACIRKMSDVPFA